MKNCAFTIWAKSCLGLAIILGSSIMNVSNLNVIELSILLEGCR
jgi:hypothetical protein